MAKKKRRRSEWFTEELWFTSDDPTTLGHGLQSLVLDGSERITDRKAQLFEVACARRVEHLLPNDLCRRTIDLAELAADAPGGPLAVSPLSTYPAIMDALENHGPPPDYQQRPRLTHLARVGLELAAELSNPEQIGARVRNMVGGRAVAVAAAANGNPSHGEEIGRQLVILHDVFGNVFRPIAVSAKWRTHNTIAVAGEIYASQDYSGLPILADALEEAGCCEAQVLEHCRSGGPHVRGCWVVDGLLDRG